jgi:hypothetical protein
VRWWLALALVLASCGPASTAAPVAAPSSRPVPIVTAPAESPAVLPSPTPTSTEPACGDKAAGSLPSGWICVEAVRHDMDGDGWQDAFVILARPASNRPGESDEWRARVVLTGGRIYEVGFAPDSVDGSSMIVGFVDADGDTRDDALVELGRGASTAMVGVFGFGRNGLAQASYQDGTMARLLFAGSVRHGAAVECRSRGGRAELVLRGISNYKADDQWDWTESVYTWSSKVLILTSERSGVIKVPHPFDPPPNEEAYWSFRCFGVDLY